MRCLRKQAALAANEGAKWYEENAEKVASAYEALDPRKVHPELFAMLEDRRDARILDVGTGTGRDASALAGAGHRVVAVDPSRRMIELARDLHPDCAVEWDVDGLPTLGRVRGSFDLIILSAVWMHLPPAERAKAFERLVSLLDAKGRIYITLRSGPDDLRRGMFKSSPKELESLTLSAGMRVQVLAEKADLLGRSNVAWHTFLIYPATSSSNRDGLLDDLPWPY